MRRTREQIAADLMEHLEHGPSFGLVLMSAEVGPDAERIPQSWHADINALYEQRTRLWLDTWVKPKVRKLVKELSNDS